MPQQLLTRKPDLDNPGQFIAEEVHVYDGPQGSGEIKRVYRIVGAVVQWKAEHTGPENRGDLPTNWTVLPEPDKEVAVKKVRAVEKIVVQRDKDNKAYHVVIPDFQEVYYDKETQPNPHPAREVIAGGR